MTEINKSTKRCTGCQIKLPVIDYKIKPNGDVCNYCDSCREKERDQYRKKSVEALAQKREKYATDKEYRKETLEQKKEKYATDEEYRNKTVERSRISNNVRVKCPDCDKEMNTRSLYAHVKTPNRCKGRKLEV